MTETTMARTETEVPGTGYRVFTSSALLRAAAARTMGDPFVHLQRDVPPDEPGSAAWADGLRDCSHVEIEAMSPADQAVILVPLMNALRLRLPAVGPIDPSLFAGARDILMRADPGVAMLAIRNSMAWEARNRPGGQAWDSGDGVARMSRLMDVDRGWFDVFVRIRRAMDVAEAALRSP